MSYKYHKILVVSVTYKVKSNVSYLGESLNKKAATLWSEKSSVVSEKSKFVRKHYLLWKIQCFARKIHVCQRIQFFLWKLFARVMFCVEVHCIIWCSIWCRFHDNIQNQTMLLIRPMKNKTLSYIRFYSSKLCLHTYLQF